MRKQKIKDIKNRLYLKKFEINQIKQNLIKRVKEKNFLFKLEKNKFKITFTKIVNRCFISNRKKCVHHKFRLSRIMLRSAIANGLIVGLKKKSF